MTEEERKEYDETKNNFLELLSSFNENFDDQVINEPEKLFFKLEINDEEYYETISYDIKAISLKTKHKYSFKNAFERFILKGYPLEKESKDILLTFSSLYEKPSFYYNSKENSFYKTIIGQGIKTLMLQNSLKNSLKPISFNQEDFDLDNEIKNIQVSIDKDGNIVSPYTIDSNSFFF